MTDSLGMIALRAIGIYAVVLVVLRVLGKRTVGNFTAFDLLVALMLGEVVDEIIYGDVTFLQGILAIGTIAAVHYLNSWLAYARPALHRLMEGQPVAIVEHGRLVPGGMRRERMNVEDVEAALRLKGIDDRLEVKKAWVEVDGIVSVIREDWAETARRRDLEVLAAGNGLRAVRHEEG